MDVSLASEVMAIFAIRRFATSLALPE